MHYSTLSVVKGIESLQQTVIFNLYIFETQCVDLRYFKLQILTDQMI